MGTPEVRRSEPQNLDYVDEEIIEVEVSQALATASELCSIDDPISEPYRSKYEARELLMGIKRKLEGIDPKIVEAGGVVAAGEECQSMASLALIDHSLGVIAIDVEEPFAAQEALDACAETFFEGVVQSVREWAGDEEKEDGGGDGAASGKAFPIAIPPGVVVPSPLALAYPAECLGVARVTSSASGTRSSLVVTLSKAADTLMQQGLLWSGRGQPRRSALYLLGSVDFIRQALGEMDRAVEAISEADGSREGRVAKLENLLTHGFYYLAQRQLDAAERGQGAQVSFDPIEWSRNACFLADFYSSRSRFSAAGRSLLAAQSVCLFSKRPGFVVLFAKAVLARRAGTVEELDGVRDDADQGCSAEAAVSVSEVQDAEGEASQDPQSSEAAGEMHGAGDPSQLIAAICAGRQFDDGMQKQLPEPPPGLPGTASDMPKIPAEYGQERDESAWREEPASINDGAGGSLSMGSEKSLVEGGEDGHVDTATTVTDEGGDEERREFDEQRKEQMADLNRHMAKLYIAVLEVKHREKDIAEELGDGEKHVVDVSHDLDASEAERDLEGFASLIGVEELPLCDPRLVGGDFESVRDVFKKAKSHTERALKYFVLDGFVSNHVALHQGLSRAYLYLSTFEPDIKRKQAMYTRRAQALEPFLKSLGMRAYGHLHKELSYELGEIYQEMADLKVARVTEKSANGGAGATLADARAVNKVLQNAIRFFSHFIAMYHDGDSSRGPADSNSQPQSDMEVSEAPGYLLARFTRARLHSKLQLAVRIQAVHAMRLSRAEFKWLTEHAPKHLSSARERNPVFFVKELELATEMVELLSRKIDALEQGQLRE